MSSPHPFPPFEPRFPWLGPDLQTLRNFLLSAGSTQATRGAAAAGDRERRLVLPLADGSGDALSARLELPPALTPSRPLLVLLHGLAGSEDSSYLAASARHFVRVGIPVLRLNLRGAGPSRPLCRLQYHAGRSEDLRDALQVLRKNEPELTREGFLLMGFSLGGNMLLKFLAEFAHALPVRAAVSVSAPIDLAASARRLLQRRNRLYHWHLLRHMKAECFGEGGLLDDRERAAVRAARSIYEFDDTFVAPRNGYPGAPAYYAENMARQFLFEIACPTLLVHALDDPWIPADAYLSVAWRENPALRPLLPQRGGHVGFHAADSRVPWHDRCAALFFRELASI